LLTCFSFHEFIAKAMLGSRGNIRKSAPDYRAH
jgi:hypothetical protein